MIKLRPAQAEICSYLGGKMGVAAVPGSGKTFTLSLIAARLVKEAGLNDDQEVLIVTLVNSAVDNFIQRTSYFLDQEFGLMPELGYRVRTLHGLAHDIVRLRPDLAGLGDQFTILDERVTNQILQDISTIWIRSHPEFLEWYGIVVDSSHNNNFRQDWPQLITDMGRAFIRMAKDLELTPSLIRERLEIFKQDNPLLHAGLDIYSEYQQALNFRSAVDFDDLIRYALKTLQMDSDYLQHLQYRWPYILEDESQDSSQLQERILRLLTGENGNWVRVGDANQAIYETFTTADPKYLRDFLKEPGVQARTLPNSGRSTRNIIGLANELIRWVREDHPQDECRTALDYPRIEPAPQDDPQSNPPDNPQGIRLINRRYSPDKEIEAIVDSIEKWLPENLKSTVAVLVPRNDRGSLIVEALKSRNLPVKDLLGTSFSTRNLTSILGKILQFLSEPTRTDRMQEIIKILYEISDQSKIPYGLIKKILSTCKYPEEFFAPRPGADWLNSLSDNSEQVSAVKGLLTIYRELIQKWQNASFLPIDQLLLTIGQDLFTKPSDLALVYKLAQTMDHSGKLNPEWQLPSFIEELHDIAQNHQRFLGFTEDDNGFDPDSHKGEVVVATMHKAKGLEWDRVYLVSVSNYDFPSAEIGDSYISEKWFVRDHLNLQEETIAYLRALEKGDMEQLNFPLGIASLEARLSYARERLRLLYVGITRARKELIITYNTGRDGSNRMATPLAALIGYMENNHANSK